MQDKNQQNSSNTEDFKKRGLGWVPDYPDLRDYNLDNEDIKNNQRLKLNETAITIEKLIVELIKSKSTEDISQNQIDALRSTIFGEVVFKKVKVYKILRYYSETEKYKQRLKLNEVKFDSLRNKQILQLKKYLFFFLAWLQTKNFNNNGLELAKPERDLDSFANDVKYSINWMNNGEEYDNDMKEIVKAFQIVTKTRQDKIVGLDVYTELKKFFKGEAPDNSENEGEKNGLKNIPLRNIKYFPLFSSINDECFEEITKFFLNRLDDNTINSNFKSYANYIDNNLFENFSYWNPDDIEINDILSSISNTSNSKDNPNTISLSDIVQYFKYSILIQPIICFVIQQMSPLAEYRYKTFAELIEQGFKKFEEILNNTDTNKDVIINEISYTTYEMAQFAIFKVQNFIDEGKEFICKEKEFIKEEKNKHDSLLIQENSEDENIQEQIKEKEKQIIVRTISYYLLKNYLNTLPEEFHAQREEFPKQNNDEPKIKFNPFDKQEVFEIALQEQFEKSSKDEDDDIVINLNLYVPITDNNILRNLINYEKEKKEDKKEDKKPYFLLPSVIDLSYYFSPVKNQGSLNSCTAFAAVSLLEYFANRNSKDKIEPSAMFLYKTARNKMNVTGDVGASIRETMKILALFGVPPEQYYPYDEENIDEEPPAYCYAFAQNYKTLKYFLLDYAGISKETLLFQIKTILASGFPCIFGLTLYTSVYNKSNEKGHIPFPDYQEDKVVGGHTLVAVGYDDLRDIKCANRRNYSQGAFLVRNSWGREWGVDGYGWLPYDYVLAGLTAAWWSLIKSEWFNENYFGSSGTGGGGIDPLQKD